MHIDMKQHAYLYETTCQVLDVLDKGCLSNWYHWKKYQSSDKFSYVILGIIPNCIYSKSQNNFC